MAAVLKRTAFVAAGVVLGMALSVGIGSWRARRDGSPMSPSAPASAPSERAPANAEQG